MEIKCPQCGATVDSQANNCQFCGASLAQAQQQTAQPQQQYAQPQQQYAQPQQQYAQPVSAANEKSKVAAGVLGIVLGGLGVHKFYLGHVGKGILYLLFCWTGIIGLVEGIIYLTSTDDKFYSTYVKH